MVDFKIIILKLLPSLIQTAIPRGLLVKWRGLLIEMEGALIRELGVVSGCLNSNVAGRTQRERLYELYHKDPEFRQLCLQRARDQRLRADPEVYRAAGKVRAAASYARRKAARLALLANASTPAKKLD
jgi:hypothetical protein